ncbi:MAG: hypothetical protein ACTSUK_08395, partial [Promethearchaeota archaeon]
RNKIKEGMLVLCETSGLRYPHDWKVGFVETIHSHNDMTIREIGTNRLCRIGNESFVPIIGMKPYQLYEKDEYSFSIKVNKAFKRADEYSHVFGGLEFLPDNEVIILVRRKWSDTHKPYDIRMKWHKKITIKKILELMKEQGFGTRDFEKDPKSEQQKGKTTLMQFL